MGRDSKYLPAYCAQLIFHMGKGFSYRSFAGKIGVHRDTLYQWEEVHKKWKHSKEMGEDASLYWWEEQGINGLYSVTTRDGDGGSSTVSMNATVFIYNMKNRFRDDWGDQRQDEPIKAKSDAPLVPGMTREQALQQLEMKKAKE